MKLGSNGWVGGKKLTDADKQMSRNRTIELHSNQMTSCLVTWDSHRKKLGIYRKIWEFTDKKTHILTNLNQKFYFIHYIWFKLFSLYDFSVYLPFFSVRFAFARINLLYPRKIYQGKFLLKNYKPKMRTWKFFLIILYIKW